MLLSQKEFFYLNFLRLPLFLRTNYLFNGSVLNIVYSQQYTMEGMSERMNERTTERVRTSEAKRI